MDRHSRGKHGHVFPARQARIELIVACIQMGGKPRMMGLPGPHRMRKGLRLPCSPAGPRRYRMSAAVLKYHLPSARHRFAPPPNPVIC
jgi:hypothetical protein